MPLNEPIDFAAARRDGCLIGFSEGRGKKTRFSDEEKTAIEAGVKKAVRAVRRRIKFDYVSIIISIGEGQNNLLIPVEGGSGMFSVTLDFDRKFPVYNSPKQQNYITGVVAHEIHHQLRKETKEFRSLDFYDLRQAFTMEGLALAFDELVVGRLPPIVAAVPHSYIRDKEPWVKDNLSVEIDDGLGEFEADHGLPDSFTYCFAYSLAKAWINYSKRSAAQALHTPASQIIDPWLERKFSVADGIPKDFLAQLAWLPPQP